MLGIAGLIGTCIYGYRRYKTQGYKISPSMYVLQLRVAAQSVVVGALTCLMVWNMVEKNILHKEDTPKKNVWY